MSFCLPKELTNKFLAALKEGQLEPGRLSEMTSAERRAEFAKVVGEGEAKEVNALFESKLLLKNQKAGMITWAKSVGGLTPQALKDTISKIEKLDKVLNPSEQDAFLHDLAEKKLGIDVSVEEAGRISELAKEAQTAKSAIPENSPVQSPERMAYGRARVAFDKYISDLKNETNAFKFSDLKNAPGRALLEGVSFVGGLAKSLKATLDFSVILRQGLKTAFTHPVIWAKNSFLSFVDAVRTLGGKEVMDEVLADVYSRPNALNGMYKKEGLDLGNTEEAFPSSLPEKIPIAGRIFKASEVAYKAWQYRTRADVFDLLYDTAQKSGAETNGLGRMVNSLTGRGHLGKAEPIAGFVNNVFFSPRFLKSNIDLLTMHAFDRDMSPFVRKQAAMNLVKVIGGLAVVYGISRALDPDSVELNPNSSDFGKIKVGDTRFDPSAGNAALVTLASRLLTQETKSSSTGKVTKLDTGKFGAPTSGGVLLDFTEGKLAPMVSTLIALRKGSDFNNKPVNVTSLEGVGNLATNAFLPLPVQNYQELQSNPNSAPLLLGLIGDALGVSTNTYASTHKK